MNAIGLNSGSDAQFNELEYTIKSTTFTGSIRSSINTQTRTILVNNAKAIVCSCNITTANNISEYVGGNSTVGRGNLNSAVTVLAFNGIDNPFAYMGQSGLTREWYTTDIYFSIDHGNVIVKSMNWNIGQVSMTITYTTRS